MIEEIKAPVFTEGMGQAVISCLYFEVGAYVNEGDILVDIETEKVVLEIVAPFSGYIKSLDCNLGQAIQSEQLLALIEEGVAPRIPHTKIENISPPAVTVEGGDTYSTKLLVFVIGVIIVAAIIFSVTKPPS